MNDPLAISWEAARAPLLLGFLVVVLLVLLIKPLILLAFEAGWRAQWRRRGYGDDVIPAPPDPWPARSLAVNGAAFGLAMGLAIWRLWGSPPGDVFVLGVLAFVAAIAEYEPMKNLLRVVGIDLAGFNPLRAFT